MRRCLTVLMLAAGLAVAIGVDFGANPGASSARGGACPPERFASFDSPGHIPSVCWRPYAASSPFNRPISRRAKPVPNSQAIVQKLLAGGSISELVAGDPALEESASPTYYSEPGDPVFRLHCVEPYGGTCEIEGMSVHIPEKAVAGGGFRTDSHQTDAPMTVVDPDTGWEYDFAGVRNKPSGGGEMNIGWGGRTRINGDGLGSAASSAHYGLLAGLVRAPELAAGRINHALVLGIPCQSGKIVYPAGGSGLLCEQAGLGNEGAPAAGARFQLAMGKKKINRLHLPGWQRAIVMALHRYGAFVSDTTGSPELWGIETEGGATYQSFGLEDPNVALGRRLGLPAIDFNQNGFGEYRFKLAEGVPWNKLRVVRPPRGARVSP